MQKKKNASGSAGNENKIHFMDRVNENKTDVIDIDEIQLNKGSKSHLVS